MIVSHQHRFIFVHCRKVAGSTLKVALAPHLGPDDVIIGSLNELVERGIELNRATKQVLRSPTAWVHAGAALMVGKSWGEALNIGLKGYYRRKLSVNPPHPTATEAQRYFSNVWDSYFKFAFVRNPYEQTASDYFWRRRMTKSQMGFEEYLQARLTGDDRDPIVHPHAVSNWDMIAIDGRMVMDYIGRYERLTEDFGDTTARLGIGRLALDVREKRGGSRDSYAEIYTPRTRALVSKLCQPEISEFEYEFPY